MALVRVEGVGPSSHPWEGYIIAVIRYSQYFNYITERENRAEKLRPKNGSGHDSRRDRPENANVLLKCGKMRVSYKIRRQNGNKNKGQESVCEDDE